jgi:hypothetical protein
MKATLMKVPEDVFVVQENVVRCEHFLRLNNFLEMFEVVDR